jgi:two-component system, cell cycle sensor histidine kinase and response regulator CckA
LLQISKAADRAAKLTKQLLAFSRKQVLKPKIVDLNVQVADVTEMLRRLLGEDIEVRTSLARDLGRIRVDPTQVEQILLNLVSNAREAMPHGGKLTIETGNVEVDEVYTRSHAGASVGGYVMIAVSDSGCGMDAATQARIFEPFFTTKHYGTGLGLATVYGAVKQSGGHIWVYSEPGRGTSFRIYFPRVAAPENTAGDETSVDKSMGSGTILLVEDSEGLRMVTREFLLLAGYTVKEAGNAEEALNISQTHEGPIDLLLTDVVLPGMDGRELAKALACFRPEMRVLFMSGYAPEIIASNGDLDEGSGFLSKPFSRSTLTRKVREVLNSVSNPACKQLQT